jgi:hypothetical protein
VIRIACGISALLLATLSGCALLPSAAPEPTPDETRTGVQVGDCWEATGVDLYEWATWEGDGPVDCAEKHQTYTFVVAQLDADVEAWDGGDLTGEVIGEIRELCDPALVDLGIDEAASRAPWYFFVADEDDWADGDHSIRCDVAVSAFDSLWGEPELENLPDDIDDLVSDVQKNPRSYELCLIGDGTGPYESTETFYADCAGDAYLWRFGGTAEYDSEAADAYPSDQELFGFANEACTALGLRDDEIVYPYIPTEQMWEAGDRTAACWFSLIEQQSEAV